MTRDLSEFPNNLRGCSRLLSKNFDDSLRPCGINLNQFFTLLYLKNNKFINIAVMARSLNTERTTLTRNLKPLLRDCYISELEAIKLDGTKDLKSKKYGLTEKGRSTLECALPLFETNLVNLSDTCRELFLEGLDTRLKKLINYLTL